MLDERIQTAFAHQQAGRFNEAAALYREILQQNPNDPDTLHLLGVTTAQLGNAPAGLDLVRRSISLRPNIPVYYTNLAFVLRMLNRPGLAVVALRKSVELNPANAPVWFTLGQLTAQHGHTAEAMSAFEHVLSIDPNHSQAHNEMGNIFRSNKRFDEAAASFQKALAADPRNAEALHNAALCMADSGQVEKAIDYEAQAMQLAPDITSCATGRCYMLNFHPGFDRPAIAAEMRKFNEHFALPLAKSIQPHANDLTPGRRLRIGYVSPDFYFQSECFFILPLLKNHDHRNFEIHCYSSVAKPDNVTRQIKDSIDVWHDVARESDEQLADRIRADQIDILIDLTMHMRNNRLLLFARKPAPVQVTWLAYPGGTGITAIDYRLTDVFMDPPDTDPFYAEKSIRLPDCWCCYDPLFDEPVGPDHREGFIRFGSLNNPAKLNEPTLELWSQVLQSMPDSRLLLLATSEDHRRRIRQLFSIAGVDEQRLEFTGYIPRPQYLRLYDRIDICLDPLPYNGITTTLDALWMGVPVVSLAGATAAGRAGLSILTTAGMSELVAQNPNEFVQLATRGRGLPVIRAGREEIRRRLRQSPLMDAQRFTANVESAYRKIWETFTANPV